MNNLRLFGTSTGGDVAGDDPRSVTDSRGHGAQGPGFTAHKTTPRDSERPGALESLGGREGAGATAPEAPVPNEPDVGIYLLSSGVTVPAWLCAACLAVKLEETLIGGSRWSAARIGTVSGHGCDGCETKRQNEGSAN